MVYGNERLHKLLKTNYHSAKKRSNQNIQQGLLKSRPRPGWQVNPDPANAVNWRPDVHIQPATCSENDGRSTWQPLTMSQKIQISPALRIVTENYKAFLLDARSITWVCFHRPTIALSVFVCFLGKAREFFCLDKDLIIGGLAVVMCWKKYIIHYSHIHSFYRNGSSERITKLVY